jgi:hypothetical protein
MSLMDNTDVVNYKEQDSYIHIAVVLKAMWI